MTRTIRARVAGRALLLEEPIDLPDNTSVEITIIIPEERKPAAPFSFLDACISANVSGPADWSEKVDHFLYGIERTE